MIIVFIAIALLLVRIASIRLTIGVIRNQVELMSRPIDEEITGYRNKLYYLTLALTGSHIIPMVLYLVAIARKLEFIPLETSLAGLLIVYAISNTIAAYLSAFIISRIYQDSVKVDTTHEESDHMLVSDEEAVAQNVESS